LRREAQLGLPAAVVAHQIHLLEPRGQGALRNLSHHPQEHFRTQRHGSREPHVAGLLGGVSRRRVRHHRVDERAAEPLGNLSGHVPGDQIVFDQRHVRPVLLGATGVDDGARLPRRHRVADFEPGEILDVDRASLRRDGDGRRQECRGDCQSSHRDASCKGLCVSPEP
jgi:hypothetical protein